MKGLLAFILLCLPVAAVGEGFFPALHSVVGVAADDVLNIRAEPSASAPIIGGFAPNARDIEVLTPPASGWGRVNTGEVSGWVAVRYLERQPGQDWAITGPFALSPTPLECYGTEPFWSLSLGTDGELGYANLGAGADGGLTGIFTPVPSSQNPFKRGFSAILDDTGDRLSGVITHGLCSDGMSDLLFGLSIDVVRDGALGRALDSGCCRITP